ncbi:polysaccharide deacetylase [Candidatus Dependentiae bacterium HGW-Dependentiae-1]|nr:MAG: polysaccharide deacetylase [Candidatus Dependentiae bacterium HGW-Dependentiae-1]
MAKKGGRMIGWLAAVACIVVIAWLITPLAPQLLGRATRRVSTQEKIVALTFDDGPSADWTPAVLELLARHDVPATFFLVGSRAADNPALAQQIWYAGHQVGNHSWSHTPLIGKSVAVVRQEIEKTDVFLRALGYTHELYFRAPWGFKLLILPWILSRLGKKHILFDVVTWDWSCPGAAVITQSAVKAVRPGSIILLHDGGGDRSQTVQATEEIIVQLKNQGYRFVTVAQLLTYDVRA